MLRISLDLDDTIFSWFDHYLDKFGQPKNNYEITKNVVDILKKDKSFWMNQEVIHRPNFTPTMYCTARSIPKIWIKEQLTINEMPKAPVYQLFSYSISKVPKIKMRNCNVHIDDSIRVFIDCNLHGVPCLLMNSKFNQEWGPIGRIYSLDKEEIEETYHLFKDTMFSYFNELLDEYRRA